MSTVNPVRIVDRVAIELTVNGAPRSSQAHPLTRLSDVLRDEFGLTGTKIGCSAGDCGACTVIVDGAQACACIVSVGRCRGASVTTVEGLAVQGVLHPLQEAFCAMGAAQCGICTPGMLMAAASLLARNARPTEEDVKDALAGVLCRCTGYQKIVEAVMALAHGTVATKLTSPASGAAVGSRLPRLDARAKVTGAELFAADLAPPDCLWLAVIRSPHAHARFTLSGVEAFRARHGLRAIISAADVPNNSFAIFDQPKDQPVLADGLVRMRGEAVLGVIGSKDACEHALADAAPICWEVLPELTEPDQALAPFAGALHGFAPDNVLCRGRLVRGDVDAALVDAAFVARGTFRTAYVEHAYIEPEAGYAEWLPAGAEGRTSDRLRIFACTQTPYMDRDEVARVMQMAPEDVHIVPSAIGGGFGGKLDMSVQPLLAVAARITRGAVRCVYTRVESMQSTTKRHPAEITAAFGCDGHGMLLALDFKADFNTGAYASWGTTVANRVPVHASGPYLVPHVRALTRAIYTHNAIAGAFRGFGVPQAHIATESLLDELAKKTGLDPLEFRLQNALRAGQATPTGQVLTASVGMARCLEELRPAWQRCSQAASEFNRLAQSSGSPLRHGAGIASMWYGIGNTVIANPSNMRGALRRNGRLFLYNGAQEIGQGSGTVIPQIFADAVGLPVALVDQIMGDTDQTLDAGKSSASRQTFVSGNAALAAGRQLRQKLVAMLGLDEPCTLSIEDGLKPRLVGVSEGRLSAIALAESPQLDVAVGEGYFNPPTVPLDANGQGVPYATYGFAAQFAEVEVDVELGTVRVLHVHAAHDVGRAVNPTQVEGQIHGGIAQGLGMALMEHYTSGKTDNLHDYLIPTVGDVPPMTTYLVEDPEPLGPFGAKGVGEPALIATAPAILNAIAAATGARLYDVPATPDRIREALLRHRT